MTNTYTLTAANLNNQRHTPRIFYRCDLCNEKPAVYAVHRIEGAQVITATVCRECKKEWDEVKG